MHDTWREWGEWGRGGEGGKQGVLQANTAALLATQFVLRCTDE